MSKEELAIGTVRAKDAALLLGIGCSTFRRWVREGKIPAGRRFSSRCVVWKIVELQAFIDAHEHRAH
ncbi:MAG: helix-turn-helix domain-containing protein [Pseudomonadota bacterium]